MKRAKQRRIAYTLLEVVVASTLLTAVVGAVAVVLRTGRTVWTAHEGDMKKYEAGQAALRHLVRTIRQATSVTSVTAAGNTNGAITVVLPSGSSVTYAFDNATGYINYTNASGTSILSEGVNQLIFSPYQADGTTVAATAGATQLVKCQVQVTLNQTTNATKMLTSWAWVRSW